MNLIETGIHNTSLQFEFELNATTLAIIAGVYIVWIVISILVYRDAKSRGMSGALWLVIVLFLSVIGLIIYLVVREPKRLPEAGVPLPYPQPYADVPVQPGANVCKRCGMPLEPGMKFCSNCGYRV